MVESKIPESLHALNQKFSKRLNLLDIFVDSNILRRNGLGFVPGRRHGLGLPGPFAF